MDTLKDIRTLSTLSIVLKGLGILMTTVCVIALVVALCSQWVIPHFSGSVQCFLAILITGINLGN